MVDMWWICLTTIVHKNIQSSDDDVGKKFVGWNSLTHLYVDDDDDDDEIEMMR
jgi:hypothetical protein